MSKGQVLVLGSNATQIGLRGGGTATVGQYLNETAVPALALLDAGYDIVLATPNGAKPHHLSFMPGSCLPHLSTQAF